MGSKPTTNEIHYWQRHVENFNTSGLTRKAYSKQARINVYRLDYWRKKLSRMRGTPEQAPAQQWMPVKISKRQIIHTPPGAPSLAVNPCASQAAAGRFD